MMFESELAPVKAALSQSFGKIYDLYADLAVFEHRGELLLFCGVESVTYKDAVSDGQGGHLLGCEAVFSVQLYGRRGLGAAELHGIFDESVIPALKACAGKIKAIKCLPCRYSKEQGGYIMSAELIFTAFEHGAGGVSAIEFSIGGMSYNCMTGYEIESPVKTAETPLLNGTIRSRKVGVLPRKLTVRGILYGNGAAVYDALKSGLGAAASDLTVGGIDFSGMMMSDLKLSGKSDGSSELSIVFTEVDEI